MAAAGRAKAERVLGRWVQKGRIASEEQTKVIDRIVPLATYEGFEKAEIVIEAVVEQAEVKKTVYKGNSALSAMPIVLSQRTRLPFLSAGSLLLPRDPTSS